MILLRTQDYKHEVMSSIPSIGVITLVLITNRIRKELKHKWGKRLKQVPEEALETQSPLADIKQ